MEEEDDLEALRLAALQTIKPKKYQNVYRPKDHIPYYRPLTNPNLIAIVPKEEPFFTPPPESPSVEVHKKVEVKEKSPESDENVEEEKTIRSKFRRDSENEIVKLDEDQLDFECEGESDLLELHNDDSLEKLMDEMEQEFNEDSPRAKNGTTKRDKRKPSPKVEEPKRSLTPKEKLSPYYDKRRSPSPRRRSPIRRRSRSPWLKRSNSPRRRSPSPRKRSITPRRRSFSPRKRSLTPRKRSISPKRRSRSPRYRRSPIRRSSISPRFRRRTPSPRRSPIRRRSPSLSPRRSPRRSPVRLKRLSPRRKLSPRRSLSPRSSRRRPSPLYRSPRRSLSPRKRISPRRKRSRSPLPKPRRSPEKRRPNLPKEEKKSEEKEEVVDPKLEARRKKFESNSVVAPTQKKIRLKTTQEEEEEEKPQNNHTETIEEETDLNINENPLLLRILNRKKIDLEEGSLDIKDLVNRLNKADKVKTEKKSKRRPVLINQIEDAISEEPKILEKAKKKKAKVAPILFSEGAKLKKKKVEKVIEIEDDVVEVPSQVKIKEKADEGTDLRAELSRRRAERLKETKFQPAMRIIQSAIEGAVIGNRKRLQKPDEIAKKMSLQGRRVRVVDPDNVPENDSEEDGEEDEEDFNSIGSYGTLRMTTIRSGKRFK